MYYLEKVNFTTSFGDHVSFDENGDPIPTYDVMNWAWLPDGSTHVQNVGVVRKSASGEEELIVHEDRIFWNVESTQVRGYAGFLLYYKTVHVKKLSRITHVKNLSRTVYVKLIRVKKMFRLSH